MNKKMMPACKTKAAAVSAAFAILSVAFSPAVFAQTGSATPSNGANATTTMSPGTSANSSYSPPVDDYKKGTKKTRRHRASKKMSAPATGASASE